MMTRLASIHRRFVASTSGVAAIEFAGIASVLFLVFLATFDAARAIAVDMKVRSAAYTLDAVTNQYVTIQDTDMEQILGATSVVLSPYPSAPVVVVISQLTVGPGGTATVVWSDQLHGVARTPGSAVTLPPDLANVAVPGSTLIFGEVSYTYTPLFGYFTAGGITLFDNLYVTPRAAAAIARVRS